MMIDGGTMKAEPPVLLSTAINVRPMPRVLIYQHSTELLRRR